MKNFIYACIVFLVCSCSVKSSNDKIKSLILENDVYELTGFCKKHTKLIKEKGDTYLSYATHPLNEDAVCILIQYYANMHFMFQSQDVWRLPSALRFNPSFLLLQTFHCTPFH